MVGNKAQKAVAAALTGMLALGSVAPALANTTWVRVDGSYLYEAELFGAPRVNTAFTAASGKSGQMLAKGVDRYDTMRHAVGMNITDDMISYTNTNWFKTKDIVLVSGTSYADALSASGLAGVLDAPLVTTPSDKLGEDAEAIIRYCARQVGYGELTVHIVGGTAAVSDDVVDSVRDIDTSLWSNNRRHTADSDGESYGIKVLRVAGADRTETSLEVLDEIIGYESAATGWQGQNVPFTNGLPTVFVANGWAWADALSVSSYAYMAQSPILLTDSAGNLTQDQVDYLADEFSGNRVNVKVIGGPAEASLQQFEGTLKDNGFKAASVSYIAGDDRYDTNAKVVNQLGYYGDIAVATGRNWPDALIGGAFMGARGGTLVLVGEQGTDKNWDAAIKEVIAQGQTIGSSNFVGLSPRIFRRGTDANGNIVNNKTNVSYTGNVDHFILGGEAAVSKNVADRLARF